VRPQGGASVRPRVEGVKGLSEASGEFLAVSGSIMFMQIFEGTSLERGCQIRVGSLKMAIFASFVHCLPNILHIWPQGSIHVIRLSMTLAIFQGH